MASTSGWNEGTGFSFPPNTNVNDPNGMPSDAAQAAREKAKKVLLALQEGEPGDADEMMGKREPKGNVGIMPLDWLKTKFGGKKEKKESSSAVR